jgi:hypothetical protein
MTENSDKGPSTPPVIKLYRPLKEHEIRVLEILPGTKETIQCQLIHTSLEKPASYNALSYTWGDSSRPRVEIIIDGQSLKVTENCAAALYELRQEATASSKRQIIWIDAICINQNDLGERSQQVLLMGEIYRSCCKLIIWLGPESDDSASAIKTLKEICTSVKEGTIQQWHINFTIKPDYLDRWAQLACLYSRPWFTRVWTVQEYVICAKKSLSHIETDEIEFYCGRDRISADTMATPLDVIIAGIAPVMRELESVLDDREKYDIQMKSLDFMRGYACFLSFMVLTHPKFTFSECSEPTQFFRFVMVSLRRDSTDPRDRIYAHLYNGLPVHARNETRRPLQEDTREATKPSLDYHMSELVDPLPGLRADEQCVMDSSLEIPKLIVDYEATVEDVYSSLVRLLISSSQRLDILSLCFRRSSSIRRTWTVDLVEMSRAIVGMHSGLESAWGLLGPRFVADLSRLQYHASKTSKANVLFNSNPSILSPTGFRFSVVTLVVEESLRWDLEIWRGRIEVLVMMTASALKVERKEALQAIWNVHAATNLYPAKITSGAFGKWASWLSSSRINNMDDVNNDRDTLEEWDFLVKNQVSDRTLFFADSGSSKFIGKGWNTMKKGDIVCIIFGCDVPLVVRQANDHFVLVGDCYVEGNMNGEAMDLLELGKVKEETFSLR